MPSSAKPRVRFGPFEVDLQTQELWKNGIRLKLGGQPFGILIMLLERPGELVTREELRAKLWSADTFVDFNHGLNAAVNKLRECLNDSPDAPKYVETLPRRGYRFVGAVAMEPAAAPTTSIAAMAMPDGYVRFPVSQPPIRELAWEVPVPAGRLGVPYRWIATLVLAALLGVAVLFLWNFEHKGGKSTEARAAALTGVSGSASDPSFSPRGDEIAYRKYGIANERGLYVTSLADSKDFRITDSQEDCCPVWSPDGKSVAFTRSEGDVQTIYVIPVHGGMARKLHSAHHKYGHGELDWSPDGKTIVFSGDAPNGGAQLFAISVDQLEVRPLTRPQGQEIDWGPAISPDGRRMAFVRARGRGEAEEISVSSLDGDAVQQLTFGQSRIIGPPTWTSDGKWLLFASNLGTSPQGGETRLWRVPSTGGSAETIPGTGSPSWHPNVSRTGNHLAYQRILGASTIWRLSLNDDHDREPHLVVATPDGRNEGPQISPNGKKLAFMSDRNGSMEIWISDADGSYPEMLSGLGGCGSPRWSPDSRSIVFDSVHTGRAAVYRVDLDERQPRLLVEDESENMVPSWSNDGQWIYFASSRSGQDQVWKVPAEGGQPVPVTKHGGFAPRESPDGKYVYYTNSRDANPQVWQIPVGGGPETLVSPLLRPGDWANLVITDSGMFFIDNVSAGQVALEFFEFKSGQARTIRTLPGYFFWLSASSDGNTMWYGQDSQGDSTIMVRRNFH